MQGFLVRRSEGKRPLASSRRKWEGNIRMGLQEVGWEGGGRAWTGSIWLRKVNPDGL
jgi:hypothetical protein